MLAAAAAKLLSSISYTIYSVSSYKMVYFIHDFLTSFLHVSLEVSYETVSYETVSYETYI